jgi:RimJ/RimL family protein N-acetyltransferase
MSVYKVGKVCDLAVRDHILSELEPYTDAIMRQDTTEFMLTGSYPMRWIDSKQVWDKERENGDVLFSIFDKAEKFIGICGLHNLRDIYHSAELRILIFDKDAVGKGIGTEAVKLLVDYGFNRLNLHRIWLGVNADNERAVKCYLKAGFKEEGRLREDIFYHGKYADAVRMGILRSEWKGLHAEA